VKENASSAAKCVETHIKRSMAAKSRDSLAKIALSRVQFLTNLTARASKSISEHTTDR
jgi:hypothetical protein